MSMTNLSGMADAWLPDEAEEAAPVSIDGVKKHLVDQDSDIGGAVFSRLAPVARLSKTPEHNHVSAAGPIVLLRSRAGLPREDAHARGLHR